MRTQCIAAEVLVLLTLAACDDGTSNLDSPLASESSTLDFGRVLVGSSRTLSVAISNTTDTFVDVTWTGLADTSGDFTVVSGYDSIDLAPRAGITFDVMYTPSDDGAEEPCRAVAPPSARRCARGGSRPA